MSVTIGIPYTTSGLTAYVDFEASNGQAWDTSAVAPAELGSAWTVGHQLVTATDASAVGGLGPTAGVYRFVVPANLSTGDYTIRFWQQAGGSPSFTADKVLATSGVFKWNNAAGLEVLFTESLTTTGVTLGAYASGEDPATLMSAAGYTSARAAKLDELDAAISSRMATFSYTAPDNADIVSALGALNDGTHGLAAIVTDLAAAGGWTTTIAEAYAAPGAAFTPAEALYMIWSLLANFTVTGEAIDTTQLDGTTPAMTITMNSATQPTANRRTA